MVKQSAPDWLRDYADENRLFHCTEVSVLYLVVLDADTKGLPSGAGSDALCSFRPDDEFVRHDAASFKTGSAPSGDQVSLGNFDPKNATLPSQPPDPRF